MKNLVQVLSAVAVLFKTLFLVVKEELEELGNFASFAAKTFVIIFASIILFTNIYIILNYYFSC